MMQHLGVLNSKNLPILSEKIYFLWEHGFILQKNKYIYKLILFSSFL